MEVYKQIDQQGQETGKFFINGKLSEKEELRTVLKQLRDDKQANKQVLIDIKAEGDRINAEIEKVQLILSE